MNKPFLSSKKENPWEKKEGICPWVQKKTQRSPWRKEKTQEKRMKEEMHRKMSLNKVWL